MILLAFILASLAQPVPQDAPPAPEQPTPTTPAAPAPSSATPPLQPPKLPTARFHILRITGELDSDLFLRTILTELDSLRSLPLVVLELDGNRARPDLTARLGQRLATQSPPIALFLKDSIDKRVALPYALLSGFTPHCFIDPVTRIESDDSLRHLAPSDLNWDSIDQDLSGALWRKLTSLDADQSLPLLLLAPSADTYAVPVRAGEPWKLSSSPPAAGQAGPQPRQIIWKDPVRITIDAQTAIGLRLCAGEARSMAPILTAAGLSPRSSSSRRTPESGLPAARALLSGILDESKLALRRIHTTLSTKPPDRPMTTSDFRRIGQSALDQIARLHADLDRAESLLADYPELNHRAPGDKPLRPSDKGEFRPILDSLRKDLDKHRTTARDFASR
jgi:hypothetical protein